MVLEAGKRPVAAGCSSLLPEACASWELLRGGGRRLRAGSAARAEIVGGGAARKRGDELRCALRSRACDARARHAEGEGVRLAIAMDWGAARMGRSALWHHAEGRAVRTRGAAYRGASCTQGRAQCLRRQAERATRREGVARAVSGPQRGRRTGEGRARGGRPAERVARREGHARAGRRAGKPRARGGGAQRTRVQKGRRATHTCARRLTKAPAIVRPVSRRALA